MYLFAVPTARSGCSTDSRSWATAGGKFWLGVTAHPAAEWQNAYAERLIGSIRRECLDHVVVFGEQHLRHLLLSHVDDYNTGRSARAPIEAAAA